MKIKRDHIKGSNARGDRGHWYYVASHPYGWLGIGLTPRDALLDMQHEFRQFADSAEVGKCLQGRFHKPGGGWLTLKKRRPARSLRRSV